MLLFGCYCCFLELSKNALLQVKITKFKGQITEKLQSTAKSSNYCYYRQNIEILNRDVLKPPALSVENE